MPTTAPDALGHVDDVLAVWPRLTHDQRIGVRDRLLAPRPTLAGHVDGPLLACLVAEAPDCELTTPVEDDRQYLASLVNLPIALSALCDLAAGADRVPGALSATVIGERFTAAFRGTTGREYRHAIIDAAVMSTHLTYDEAATLLASDARLVLARADAPFADVAELLWADDERLVLDREASYDWLVAKHQDCPADVVEDHIRHHASYTSVLRAVDTPVSDAYVAALLRHGNQSFRRMATRRLPRTVVRVLHDRMGVPKWRHLAEDCTPGHGEYVEAYLGHAAVPVRTSYVRAHPNHADVAARALADESRHVRTALVRYTRDATHLAALADDPSPAIRREAAARLMRVLQR